MTRKQAIKIGPIHYVVKEVEGLRDGDEKLDGNIKYGEGVIYVEASLTGSPRRQVLWHEILHALVVHTGRRKHDDELIDALAYGIMQVLQDNPFLRVKDDPKTSG